MVKSTVAAFIQSLYDMLQQEDPAILCWTADGLAFEIHDQDRLVRLVLPRYFRHAKFSSFQRQLNYFGFKKWSKQKATVCTYGCSWFTRDAQHLSRICRRARQVPSPQHNSNKLLPQGARSLPLLEPKKSITKDDIVSLTFAPIEDDGLGYFDWDVADISWLLLEQD